MERPTLEQVLQQLAALYVGQDVYAKAPASKWLDEFQRSVHAWELSDQLLQLRQDDISCYFAATTMKTKILSSFHELPADTHPMLRETLLNHLVHMPEPSARTQLCLAVAYLAIQMARWKDPIPHLWKLLGEERSTLPAFLQTMTFLCEEVNHDRLRIGLNRRNEFYDMLRGYSGEVFKVMETVIDKFGSEGDICRLCMACTGSWLRLCAIPPQMLIQSRLLTVPFEFLKDSTTDDRLYEAACDCICGAMFLCEDTERYLQLAEVLVPRVLSLTQTYVSWIQSGQVGRADDLCRVFTDMAESFMSHIAHTPGEGLGDLSSVNILLQCMETGTAKAAQITFNFWYRLSEEIYRRTDELDRMAAATTSQASKDDLRMERETILTPFRPLIERMVRSLLRLAQLDEDHEGLPSTDADMKEFRVEVYEVLRDVSFICGSVQLTSLIFNGVMQAGQTAWYQVEAALFIMQCMCLGIHSDEENSCIPALLSAILQLPADCHIALQNTAMRLIGELARWLDCHPDYLKFLFSFLQSRIHIQELAPVVAATVRQLCEHCQQTAVPHFQDVAQVVAEAESLHLPGFAVQECLYGIGFLVGKLPKDVIGPSLQKLCEYQVTGLKKAIQSQGASSSADAVDWIDRLAAVFKHPVILVENGTQHPCQGVVLQLWPVMQEVAVAFVMDWRVMEHWCRFVRYALRLIGDAAEPLLSPLVTLLVNLYSKAQHSCFLYLCSVLVDMFSGNEVNQAGLTTMMEHFCGEVFKKIFSSKESMVQEPDTVDDFFRLCVRFLQNLPVIFLQSRYLGVCVECGLVGLSLIHREASASVTRFFVDLIHCASDERQSQPNRQICSAAVSAILQQHGLVLTQRLIEACAGTVPYELVSYHADVLLELIRFCAPQLSQWLQQTLMALPRTTPTGVEVASEEQLARFHQSLLATKTLETVRLTVKDFYNLFA